MRSSDHPAAFSLADDLFARHIYHDRSRVIYTQSTNDMLNGEVIRLDGTIRMAPR